MLSPFDRHTKMTRSLRQIQLMENRERRGYSRGLYRAVTMFLRCRLPLSAAPLITYHDPASTNRAIASTFSGAISRGWLMRHHRWGVTIHETPKRVTRSDVIRRKIHRNRRMDTDTFYLQGSQCREPCFKLVVHQREWIPARQNHLFDFWMVL